MNLSNLIIIYKVPFYGIEFYKDNRKKTCQKEFFIYSTLNLFLIQ